MKMEELQNFIDGSFVKCSKHIDSYNPATGEVFLKVPDSGPEDVDRAVQAAKRAFKSYVLLDNHEIHVRVVVHITHKKQSK